MVTYFGTFLSLTKIFVWNEDSRSRHARAQHRHEGQHVLHVQHILVPNYTRKTKHVAIQQKTEEQKFIIDSDSIPDPYILPFIGTVLCT